MRRAVLIRTLAIEIKTANMRSLLQAELIVRV